MARTSAGRSSLSRAVDLLDAFDSGSVYLTATELAARAGSPVSTTHRLLGELTALGLVERSEDRTYRIGARIWEWSARSPGAAGLRAAALPHLQKVHHAVRQHAQIGILVGHDVLFIERLTAPDAVVNYSVIGQRLPALASSSGLVQLAWLPEAEQDAAIAAGVRHYTPLTVTEPEKIRQRLAEIRRAGFVANDGFIHTAARGIAVPLRGHQDDLLGALSVIVPNDAAPVRPYVTLLQNAAAAIARDYAALTRGRPA